MRHFFLPVILLTVLFSTSFASGKNYVEQSISRPCASCHGSDGRSLNPAWPHLAGQEASYLKKQLVDLKAGATRHVDPAMAPFISNLTEEDINALVHYYSSKPTPYSSHKHRTKRDLGQTLYHEGNPKKHILACVACHGDKATGNGLPGFPSLKGQQIEYIIQQLKAFQSGMRDNDASHTMTMITQNMSSEEMYELAYYLASL